MGRGGNSRTEEIGDLGDVLVDPVLYLKGSEETVVLHIDLRHSSIRFPQIESLTNQEDSNLFTL